VVRRVLVLLFTVLVLPVAVAQAAGRSDGSTPAPASIVRLVTHVPARTLNAVGAGSVLPESSFPVFKLGSPLASDGKPELLSLSLAWCPHCAANNWALAVALSRFGTLHGLRVLNTGTYYCKLAANPCSLKPAPCYPFTHGLSFFHTGYHSTYLRLREVVIQTVNGKNLQRPSRADVEAVNPFDPGANQAPALDIGGAYGFLNAGYDPGALAHKSWSQIAGSLADPHNAVARHVDGLANLFTAAICSATKGRPASVCRSPGVHAVDARLRTAPGPPPPPPGGAA
jgi:hypothetical protein